MFDFNSWQNALGSVASQTVGTTLSFFPSLIGAVLTVILGLVLGNWTKSLIIRALSALKFDQFVTNSKLREFLEKAEISAKAEVVVGTLAKWLVVMLFFIAATNILGLTTVSVLLAGILGYIPRILSAVIVLAIGVFLAGLVERLVKGALASVDLHTSRLMGKVASYTVVTIAILAAFSELKIAAGFINTLFIGFVAMLALGLGLAIGLGAKDLVSRLLTDWYAQLQKDLKDKK